MIYTTNKLRCEMKRIAVSVWILATGITFGQLDINKLKNMKARSIGPAGMSGRVTAIDVVLSNPDIIYVGTASGGLWKSESGGIDWTPIFDDQKAASIGDVTIDQSNPDVVWVGSGEGNPRNSQTSGYGVYRSLDGGKNWDYMGLGETRNIHRVILDPRDSDVIYVGAQGSAWGDSKDRGVFKTLDGGKTWEKILYVNEKTGIGELVVDPFNPNKLIAGMWEFRRSPWFFKSGGEGSGMYVTFDGGKNWEKRTSKNGLPKGELGRMGIAIARSNPDIIYALVESKKNALYKSEDGGFNWKKVTEKNVGGRPFYYAEIYVDVVNENRLYNLHSTVTVSNDGGNTFSQLMTAYGEAGVHPDHHAFWGHPENPNFLMEGNDGGLNISRDRGKTWRFVENLPLAQFYHINYDMEWPYNVYGGMQDNGSWRGPAYVWRSGGIRNAYWEELFFGDGFDVVPHPGNSRFGYAMSQGGNVGRYDLITGHTQTIKPVHPEMEKLRFNWNAGIAQDPFDENTIYYGSQYLHKSRDRGENWEVISSDLTTNDQEKQKQLESGGLTYDVTGAENFTTIIAIAPSPVEEGIIWVGTDDGNVQLTQDGGKTWTDLTNRFTGVPKGSWVPQITASTYNADEAFVVINNYRRNDWKPYVFRTTNFGKSWRKIVDEDQVWGHALSVVQDPLEPNLMFLGTEFGLYLSIDGAKNWTKWTHGYPTVSTIDLKIHPREHDLIIGTFGRAAYILDDIRPLRALASEGPEILNKHLRFFKPPTAVLAINRQASGTRFNANAMFSGENRDWGAMLSFVYNPSPKKEKKQGSKGKDEEESEKGKGPSETKKDKVKVEVLNSEGDVIRTLHAEADTGLNRITWGLRRKGVRSPGRGGWGPPMARDREPPGPPVLPSDYTVRISHDKDSVTQVVNVITDPRVDIYARNLEELQPLHDQQMKLTEVVGKAVKQLQEAKEAIDAINKLLDPKENKSHKDLKKQGKKVQDQIEELERLIINPRGRQGIARNPDVLTAQVRVLSRYLYSNITGRNKTHDILLKHAESETKRVLEKINAFFDEEWMDYEDAVESSRVSHFKEYEPLRIK